MLENRQQAPGGPPRVLSNSDRAIACRSGPPPASSTSQKKVAPHDHSKWITASAAVYINLQKSSQNQRCSPKLSPSQSNSSNTIVYPKEPNQTESRKDHEHLLSTAQMGKGVLMMLVLAAAAMLLCLPLVLPPLPPPPAFLLFVPVVMMLLLFSLLLFPPENCDDPPSQAFAQ